MHDDARQLELVLSFPVEKNVYIYPFSPKINFFSPIGTHTLLSMVLVFCLPHTRAHKKKSKKFENSWKA